MRTAKRPTARYCLKTSKDGVGDWQHLERIARSSVMSANRKGDVVPPLYGYRCQHCRLLHLTRHATWNDAPLRLVYAAPIELQRWAIGSPE